MLISSDNMLVIIIISYYCRVPQQFSKHFHIDFMGEVVGDHCHYFTENKNIQPDCKLNEYMKEREECPHVTSSQYMFLGWMEYIFHHNKTSYTYSKSTAFSTTSKQRLKNYILVLVSISNFTIFLYVYGKIIYHI